MSGPSERVAAPDVDVRDEQDPVRDRSAEASDRDIESQASAVPGSVWPEADARDQAAAARDVVAEARDRGAETRDLAMSGVGLPTTINSTASMDRSASAEDRERAAEDRAASAAERVASTFDELTGAYRRTPGMIEARREIARMRRLGQELALVFVDVDGLKQLNDTRGHLAGDALLRDVGRAIQQGLRDYDLVVRYGGDEFVCLLSDTGAEDAAARLEAVNAALATRPQPGSVSYGVAALGPDDTVEDALHRADTAMYECRRARRSGPA